MSGVILGDCGKKNGLDAIDNGFIIFENYRVPRESLLNRFSNVTEDGIFQTQIESPDTRFALSLGALSTGRILISGVGGFLLQHALKIALRFAAIRQQFGKSNEPEESSIIEY